MKLRAPWWWWLLSLFCLAAVGIGLFFQAAYVNQARHVARQNSVALEVAYQASINMYRLDVETRFKSQVLRAEVLDLLEQANRAAPEALPTIRGWLYRTLRAEYRDMVAAGLRQLHFHFPDGRSLLRFHSPTHLDDPSLFDIRPSIRIANTELRAAVGFEGGRILPGFRYVFPIVRGERHLGSVELSLPFESIHQNLMDLLPEGDYALLLHRDSVRLVFEDQQDKFVAAEVHDDYFKENPSISRVSRAFEQSEHARLLNALLRKDAAVQADLATGSSFSVPVLHHGQGHIASFHAIRDLQEQHAAYVVGYSAAPVLIEIRNALLREALVVATLLLLLTCLAWLLLRNRQRLAEEKARLQAITETMGDGLYVIDAEGNTVFVNRAARELTGYSEAELLGKPAHDLFHCHAHNRFMPASDCPIGSVARNGTAFDGDESFVSKTGRIFPVEVSCRPLIGPSGPAGAVTLFRDTSAVRETLERMRLQSAALDATANAIVITDADGRIEWANPAFTALSGYPLAEAMGRNPRELVRSGLQTRELYRDMWQTILSGAHWQGEIVNRKKSGELYNEALDITPVLDPQGEVRHFIAIKQDITERKRMESELQRLATTDPLTGIANRRHFMEQLAVELERVQRYGGPAALLMLDLDHFKHVNDSYGHATGDTVLRHCVTLTLQRLRRADIFGRLGGEEFGLLLPHTDLAGAREFAESLRQQLAATPCPGPGGPIEITVSIGIAPCAEDGRDADNILAQADRALYRAKAAGRNCVVVEFAGELAAGT